MEAVIEGCAAATSVIWPPERKVEYTVYERGEKVDVPSLLFGLRVAK